MVFKNGFKLAEHRKLTEGGAADVAAGRKAFLVTRIGDVFLAVALLWLYQLCGTLSLTAINAQAAAIAPPGRVPAMVGEI